MLKIELMKKRLKEMGKTQRDLSIATGIEYGLITKVFNGYQQNPTWKTFYPICQYLGLRPESLWGDPTEEVNDETITYFNKLDPRQRQLVKSVIKAQLGISHDEKIKTLPLYREPACAGHGAFVDEQDYELVEFSNPPVSARFCVRIKGDSMQPLIDDGQLVFVNNRATLCNNDIGLFLYGEDFYCKHYIVKDNKVILRSENKRYKDIRIDDVDELKFIGRVL